VRIIRILLILLKGRASKAWKSLSSITLSEI